MTSANPFGGVIASEGCQTYMRLPSSGSRQVTTPDFAVSIASASSGPGYSPDQSFTVVLLSEAGKTFKTRLLGRAANWPPVLDRFSVIVPSPIRLFQLSSGALERQGTPAPASLPQFSESGSPKRFLSTLRARDGPLPKQIAAGVQSLGNSMGKLG